MQRSARFAALAVLVVVSLVPAAAGGQPVGERPLLVGTKEAPPFAMKSEDGEWSGLSIELWQETARRLGLVYDLREYDLSGLLRAVESGEVDVAVAALTITGPRELAMDFTHPFYSTGYGIAVATPKREGRLLPLARLATPGVLVSVGVLAALLLAVGGLVWLAERGANPDFGGSSADGVLTGIWWAASTLTTVGAGPAPRTTAGRLLGLVWMLGAVLLIGSAFAALVVAATAEQLASPIRGPADLPGARVGTLAGSASEAFLEEQGIGSSGYPDLGAALAALAADELDAVVHDAPLLQYLAARQGAGVSLLPSTFGRQDYGIALPTGSDLREPLNRTLLSDDVQRVWRDILSRALGDAPTPPVKPPPPPG